LNGIATKDPVLETLDCSLEELKKLQKRPSGLFISGLII
jgi:hypothetical protein